MMPRKVFACFCAVVALAVSPAIVSAQAAGSSGTDGDKRDLESLYVDLAVPDLPALASLGLNPTKVSRPGTLKELSVSVFPLAGGGDSLGPGVAVAWAPVYTFATSIDGYRKPVLRRLSLSLVTAKEGKTDAVNAGMGLRVTIFDHADPVMSEEYKNRIFAVLQSGDVSTRASQRFQQRQALPLVEQIARTMAPGDARKQAVATADLLSAWDTRGAAPTPFTAAEKIASFEKLVQATAQKLELAAPDLMSFRGDLGQLAAAYMLEVVTTASTIRTQLARIDRQFGDDHWNAAAASVDVGLVAQTPDGTWKELQRRKVGGLVAAAFPAGRRGQIVVQLQGRRGTGAAPPEKSFVAGGVRWLAGTSTKRLSVEAWAAKADATDPASDGTTRRFTVGSEFRVAEGFWVEAAFGSERGPDDAGWGLRSLANLKYAFKSAARFTQIPGTAEEE